MRMSRAWAMPTADTFDCPPIGDLVRRYLRGVSVDPFARNKRWATHTNDLNPNTAAEHHMDAGDFLRNLSLDGVRADVVLFDPPYSPRQISECYRDAGLQVGMKETQNSALYKRVRDAMMGLVVQGGMVLSFGWNSAGMGISRGYDIEEILLVCHGGAHNDTICTVEKRVSEQTVLF